MFKSNNISPDRVLILGMGMLATTLLACNLEASFLDFFREDTSIYTRFEDCVFNYDPQELGLSREEREGGSRDWCAYQLTEEERIQMRTEKECLEDLRCGEYFDSFDDSLQGEEPTESTDATPEQGSPKEPTRAVETSGDCPSNLSSEECNHSGTHQYSFNTVVVSGDCTPDEPSGSSSITFQFGQDEVSLIAPGENEALVLPGTGANTYALTSTDSVTGSPTGYAITFRSQSLLVTTTLFDCTEEAVYTLNE